MLCTEPTVMHIGPPLRELYSEWAFVLLAVKQNRDYKEYMSELDNMAINVADLLYKRVKEVYSEQVSIYKEARKLGTPRSHVNYLSKHKLGKLNDIFVNLKNARTTKERLAAIDYATEFKPKVFNITEHFLIGYKNKEAIDMIKNSMTNKSEWLTSKSD